MTLFELLEQSKSQLRGGFDNDITCWNGRIIKTFLGREDHGIFTFYIQLESGSQGQHAGGYALDNKSSKETNYERNGTALGMQLIIEVMKVVGVNSWEELKSKYVRVYSSHCNVYAIQNITDDKFIHFDSFIKEHKNDS